MKMAAAEPNLREHPTLQRAPLLRRRKLWVISLAFLLLLIVLLGAVTWYYADEIKAGAFELDHSPPEFSLEIVAIDDSTVTLTVAEGSPKLDEPGIVGLWNENGYAQVSEILQEADGRIVRSYELLDGGLAAGDRVKYERYAFPGHPGRAFGLDFTEVQYPSPLGMMPAWFVPGESDTWAVLVHGRTASREETLRALAIVNEAGLPALAIGYRNDEGLPQDPSGRYNFGATEWEDLHAAVEYALSNGAADVVLFGFSMGGGIVSHFMIESDLSDTVAGIVLDSPMLNLTGALNLAASQRRVPQPIPAIAAVLSSIRFDVDWAVLDVREELLEVEHPVLLIHGTADRTVPVSQSDGFAADAGSNVTYVRVEGAEHVGSWNVDPDVYRDVLLAWLGSVAGVEQAAR